MNYSRDFVFWGPCMVEAEIIGHGEAFSGHAACHEHAATLLTHSTVQL